MRTILNSMKKLFILLALTLSFPAFSAWEMNEVSYLLPLPTPGYPNRLWAADTAAKNGQLLPRSVYQELPMLVVLRDREWLYQALRVVAFRVDPCFQEGTGNPPCRRQLRFVWQPLEETRGQWMALDAAVHTFHDLNEAEWKTLKEGLSRLRTRYPQEKGLALQVHPRLAKEGIGSAYGRELSRILFSLAGPGNLTRATAMTVNTEGTVWVFTGFDLKDGVATRIPVPRTKNVAQAFFANLERPLDYRSTMNPFPQNEAPFLSLLRDSAAAEREMTEAELQSAVRSSLRALNPRLSNPGTVDCASCHAARGVPAWASEKFPRWNWDSIFGDDLFRAPGANLTDTTVQPRRTNILRAFGYFGTDPVISPRTVFETALVAGAMEE